MRAYVTAAGMAFGLIAVWAAPGSLVVCEPRPRAPGADRGLIERWCGLAAAYCTICPADAAEAHRVGEARHLRGRLVLAVR